MAECGIKKYDELPAVVGWIDVDMTRWVLYRHLNKRKIESVPYIGFIVRHLTYPSMTKERAIFVLEKAYKQHKENKK